MNDAKGMDRPAPAPQGTHGARAAYHEREHHHASTATVHAVTAIGIDMGKNTLHMVGLDTRGTIVLREKVSRGRVTWRLANLPPRLIGAESVLQDAFATDVRARDSGMARV